MKYAYNRFSRRNADKTKQIRYCCSLLYLLASYLVIPVPTTSDHAYHVSSCLHFGWEMMREDLLRD